MLAPVNVKPAPSPPWTLATPVPRSSTSAPVAVTSCVEPRAPVMTGAVIVSLPGVVKVPAPSPSSPPAASRKTSS